jgi:hypothetical protein
MTAPRFAISDTAKERNAIFGSQAPLILAVVPAAADQTLVGKTLTDAGALTVAGVYRCLIPLAGMVSAVKVLLKATISAGTATSDVDSLYFTNQPQQPATWVKYTAASNDGSLTTVTLQTVTITPAGEQWAVVTLHWRRLRM